jgi:hypothetical protein
MSFMTENPKRALLVIDVQNEYFTGKLPITYPAGSLANVLSAMDAARAHGVEFLSDGTGTLAIKNDAGEVSDEELHRAILVTQQMRFSRVMKTGDWIKQL